MVDADDGNNERKEAADGMAILGPEAKIMHVKPRNPRQDEITSKRIATTRRNLVLRREAMTDEERGEEVARRAARYRELARRGWVTRRKAAGLPAGPAPRTRAVRMYVADLETLRRFHPDAKRAVRLALEGLSLAVEVGGVKWDGDGWRLGDGPWKALGGAGAVEGRQPCPDAGRTQHGAFYGHGGASGF